MKGFSLAEILLAIIFIAFIMFSLIFLSGLSLKESLYQTNIQIATNLAIEKMEELKKKDFNNLKSGFEKGIYGYPEFQRKWIVETNPQRPNLKKIIVIINWKSKTIKPIHIQLITYKSDI